MPPPPRRLVFPSLLRDQAKPTRAPRLFADGSTPSSGTPGSPRKVSPLGACGNTVECTLLLKSSSVNRSMRPTVSCHGGDDSYRNPRFNVSLGVGLKSS